MPLNKLKIKQSFGSAAGTYDSVAVLQRTVAHELLSGLEAVRLHGAVLDIGTGTGYLSQALLKHNLQQLIALDLALPMLQTARHKLAQDERVRYVCADAEHLPLADSSIHYIYSNLALQWCGNLHAVLLDMKRVLKPEGQLVFSTFGAQTLRELKQAWAMVDRYQHVNEFQDEQQLYLHLQQAGFKNIHLESKLHTPHYRSVLDLMRELKGLGANNALNERNKYLTSKSQMQRMINAYPVHQTHGKIIATYDVIQVRASR